MERDLRIAHAEQYAGLWGMEQRAMRVLEATVQRMDLRGHVRAKAAEASADAEPGAIPVAMAAGNIAVLELRGTMTKYGSSLSDAPSSLAMARTIRGLTDKGVRGIVCVIDSPGGLVAGTDDLHRSVIRARKAGIPTVAFCEDLCASCGYWFASAFDRIVSNPGGDIGAIGVYTAFTDVSAAYEAAGVRVDVIASTPIKGAGTAGTALSEAQRAEWQREVDTCANRFVRAISVGRGVSRSTAASWADARLHGADAALELGLIDAVGDIEDAIALCASLATTAGDRTMSTPSTMPAAATAASEAKPSIAAAAVPVATIADPQITGAEDMPVDEEEDDEEVVPTDGAPAPEVGAEPAKVEEEDEKPAPDSAAGTPATVAQLKALGIDDNAFIVAALERGASVGSAMLAWELTTETRSAQGTTAKAPASNTPVANASGAGHLGGIPTGAEAGQPAAWSEAFAQNTDLQALAKAAGFRDRRTFAQFAAGEARAGRDVVTYLRRKAVD